MAECTVQAYRVEGCGVGSFNGIYVAVPFDPTENYLLSRFVKPGNISDENHVLEIQSTWPHGVVAPYKKVILSGFRGSYTYGSYGTSRNLICPDEATGPWELQNVLEPGPSSITAVSQQYLCALNAYLVQGCGSPEVDGVYTKALQDSINTFYIKDEGKYELAIGPGAGWPYNTGSSIRLMRNDNAKYSAEVMGVFGCPFVPENTSWITQQSKSRIYPPLRGSGPTCIIPWPGYNPCPSPSPEVPIVNTPFADEFDYYSDIDIDIVLDTLY